MVNAGNILVDYRTVLLDKVFDATDKNLVVEEDWTINGGFGDGEEVGAHQAAITTALNEMLRAEAEAEAAIRDSADGAQERGDLLSDDDESPEASEILYGQGEVLTDPSGTWVTDYDNPLPSNTVPGPPPNSPKYIPFDEDDIGKPAGWTDFLDVADPAQPDAAKTTLKVQYQFRVAGMEGTDDFRVVEHDGKYYPSRYYSYDYEMQKAYTANVSQSPGHEWKVPGNPEPWEKVSRSDISEIQSRYPDETFYVPTPGLDLD